MRRLNAPKALAAVALLASSVLTSGCPPAPPAMWSAVQFKIYTGGDDLNGSKSVAVGYLGLPNNNGQGFSCYLNTVPPGGSLGGQMPVIPPLAQGSPTYVSWGNDSTNTVTCPFSTSLSGSALVGATVSIGMWQAPCDTFCDNWDVEGLNVTLIPANNQSGPACELNTGFFGPGDHGESPGVARLKGSNSQLPEVSAFTQAYTIPQPCS
jgi:hypothetical protein